MVVQYILDFLASLAAGIAATIPPFPVELQNSFDALGANGQVVAALMSKFDPIIPFGVMAAAISVWLILMQAWLVTGAVRIAMWVFNR